MPKFNLNKINLDKLKGMKSVQNLKNIKGKMPRVPEKYTVKPTNAPIPETSENANDIASRSLQKINKRGLGAKRAQAENRQDKFRSAILFIITILFLMLVFIEGSSGWTTLHNFVRGFFGINCLLVPILLGLAAWRADSEVDKNVILATPSLNIAIVVIVAGSFQVLFNGSAGDTNPFHYIQYLYRCGVEDTYVSGGVLSFIMAYPLLGFMGTTGARIITILLLITVGFWASQKSPMDLFLLLKDKIQNSSDSEMPDDSEVPLDYTEEESEPTATPLRQKLHNFIFDQDAAAEDVPAEPDAAFSSDAFYDIGETYPYPEPTGEVVADDITAADDPIIEFSEEIPDAETMMNDVPADTAASDEMLLADAVFVADDSPTDDMPDGEMLDDALQSIVTGAIFGGGSLKETGIDIDIQDKAADFPEDTADSLDIPVTDDLPDGTVPMEPAEPFMETVPEEVVQEAGYQLPSIDMLYPSSFCEQTESTDELKLKAKALKDCLKSFNVDVDIDEEHGIKCGPTVTRFEVQPKPGVKVSKITNLADDIALNLKASGSVRMEAPIPGMAAIGIEIPNATKNTVALREILESDAFRLSPSKLTFAVGKDITGNIIVGDIARMPHMIIAGSTGSGKSVCTNSIIMSILFNATPDEVKLILIDPKIVEFRVYEGVPHLLIPVVTDPKKAAGALNWAVKEMLHRYQLFADANVRDIYDYNRKAEQQPEDVPEENRLVKMPQIVIAIDELADLMMAASKEVEDSICRLAQMARAAGMHLIIATQRPTTDIITGLIKANIPSRIALSVMSQIDSRTILDTGGAEKLLGHGDMLYLPNGLPKPIRVQGCFTSTAEIEAVVSHIKNQMPSEYDSDIMEKVEENVPVSKNERSAGDTLELGSDEQLVEDAIDIVVQAGMASTSLLQRKLKLGFARAARIIDNLETLGIIGPYEGAKPRKVLMTPQQLAERRARGN